MKEIKLGTIGSGVIVESVLAQVARVPGIRLTAVCSRSREKGTKLAETFGAGAVYTDWDALLDDPNVNCVYIASPNSLHYPQTRQALLAGKHVWCEKPFCTASAQARDLASLARQKNLLLAEAVPTAFLPNLEIIKQQLPRIGRLRLVQGNYSQYSSRYDQLLQGQMPNVFNPAFGGGCLMDINYYNVYLNVALFGKPRSVHYFPNLHSGGADTSGILVLCYPDFVSQASGAKDTWYDNAFSIQGEKGFLEIPGGSNGLRQVRVVTRTTDECLSDQSDPERLFYEVQTLTGLFLREDRETLDRMMETTIAVMEVLEEGRKSAAIRFLGET